MNVEDLLISKDISFIPRGKDFEVRCLNPEHPDRNPSMSIDQVTGIFNCFSCEFTRVTCLHTLVKKPIRWKSERQLLKKKIER